MSYIFEFLGVTAVFSIFIKWFNRITGAALAGFGFRLALSRAAD